MKTKFFVIVLCLSFVLLTVASGTILVRKCMCQWTGNALSVGYSAQGHYVAGALTNYLRTGSLSMQQGYGATGAIVAGALLNRSGDDSGLMGSGSQARIVSGALTHRSGFSSMSLPGQNDLYSSWGMRTADYYFHGFFSDPLMGLGDYMNYMQGLHAGVGSSVAATGFPVSYYNYDYNSNWVMDPGLPQYVKNVIPEKKFEPLDWTRYPKPSPWLEGLY